MKDIQSLSTQKSSKENAQPIPNIMQSFPNHSVSAPEENSIQILGTVYCSQFYSFIIFQTLDRNNNLHSNLHAGVGRVQQNGFQCFVILFTRCLFLQFSKNEYLRKYY